MNIKKSTTKLLLTIIAAYWATPYLHAAPVSLKDAQNVALNWMSRTTGKYFSVNEHTKSLSSSQTSTKNSVFGASTYRIIQLKPRGWVIVSSDDSAWPVIGYGQSRIDPSNVPPQFAEWMQGVDRKIKSAVRSNKKAPSQAKLGSSGDKLRSLWATLRQDPSISQKPLGSSGKKLSAGGPYVVEPLLWEGGNGEESGIRWDQGKYYNYKCPADSSAPPEAGGHVFAGCVATAVGQVLRHYKRPTVGKGSHGYQDYNYGWQYANFGDTVYNWSNMPFKLDENSSSDEVEDVAKLLYHIGVAVEMEYGIKGSNASYIGEHGAAYALKNYFGFGKAKAELKSNYSDQRWERLIKTSLKDGNPVLYGGLDPNPPYGGHAFVLDGYTNDGYYHFNWGFSGLYNGNFLLSHLVFTVTDSHGNSEEWNFTDEQRAIFMKGTYSIAPDRLDSSWQNNQDQDQYDSADISLWPMILPALFGILALYRRQQQMFVEE